MWLTRNRVDTLSGAYRLNPRAESKCVPGVTMMSSLDCPRLPFKPALFFVGLLLYAAEADAQQKWSFELCGTMPYNVSLPLVIRQSGQPDIDLTARYRSEPLVTPVCWVWRIGHWSDNRSWELQAIHHKLYLENVPPEVQSFSISHGLNLITINRGWFLSDYVVRVGAGIALAHPREYQVRGKPFPEDQGIFGMGNYVSGPALIAGGGKQLRLTGGLFFIIEAMAAASYADVPVKDGNAHVYNVVFQINFGLGYGVD